MRGELKEGEAIVDREWQAFWAVVHLPGLGHKRSTIFHYNDPEHETVDWPGLEAMMGPWSHREQVLMQVARALFDAGTEMPLPAL